MRPRSDFSGLVVGAMLFCAGLMPAMSRAAGPDDATNPTAIQPGDANTPTRASHNGDDTQVTQQIHGALMREAGLSPESRMIEVRTNGDAVVLRGSVAAQEKDRILQVVSQYAGARQVDNQLTIRDR